MTDRKRLSSFRRMAVVGMALCLTLFAAPLIVSAQSPTITGLLNNFDVPNNVKDAQGNPRETEGFEIQLEGIQPVDIIFAFGEAASFNALDPSAAPPAPCYIRYCRPTVIAYSDPLHPPFGSYVRWTVAGWDSVAHKFTSNFNIPGTVLTSAGTPPIAVGTFFAGHECWSLGLSAKYPQAGCEHLGVTLTKVPVAATYRWIVGDSSTGVLTYADGTQLPTASSVPPLASVNSLTILAPAAQIVAGQVQAVLQAQAPAPPPPAALAHRYGLAQWVKVYKKEISRQADLDELVGGHPNENVPGILGDTRDVNAVAETEWKLLQLDTCNTDKGGSQLVNHGGSSHGVVRRYEFYKYAGPAVAPGGNTGCGGHGATALSSDDQEASQCPRDPVTLECLAPGDGEIGDFLGAQNAAQNLDLNDGSTPQTITFAALPDHTFGDTPLTLDATGGDSGNPVTFGSVGNCSVASQTLTLNGIGGCVVTAYQAGNATFAPATDVMRSFIINNGAPQTQTISFDPLAGAFKYGDAPFQVSATSSSGLTVSFAGNGACTVLGTTVTIIGAGQCNVTASQAGDANHGPAASDLQSTNIAKATLTVAAAPVTKAYGALDPSLTFSAIGFVLGDTEAVLTGALTRAAGDSVGKYPISQGTLAATNYTITFTSSTLDITPASATVTAGNGTKVFGAPDGPITASGSGFLAADGITVSATRAAGENVGSYVTTATAAGALANYNVTFVPGSFIITRMTATVTAGNGAKVFGAPDGPITASASGFLASDGITVSATRAAGENVGSYVTTATAAGAALTNYNVTSVPGSFIITPAASKVTVSCPASVTFTGSALTPCTATVATAGGLSGALTVSYTNNTAVGTATASATYAGDANHTGSTGTSSFSITAPPVAITIVNPGPQVNEEGDYVELRIKLVGAAPASGVFAATGLPNGLYIAQPGIIRGRVKKNTEGVYQVTVTFTQGGVTASQTFRWRIKDE
jgi:hypothetical protein